MNGRSNSKVLKVICHRQQSSPLKMFRCNFSNVRLNLTLVAKMTTLYPRQQPNSPSSRKSYTTVNLIKYSQNCGFVSRNQPVSTGFCKGSLVSCCTSKSKYSPSPQPRSTGQSSTHKLSHFYLSKAFLGDLPLNVN